MYHRFSLVVAGLALGGALAAPGRAAEIQLAQGILAGEATATTVILQTRLTASAGLVAGDVPGAAGVAQFEIAAVESFANSRPTEWLEAVADRDFIVKTQVSGLRPATRYYYRVLFGPDRIHTRRSAVAQFRTLPAATAAVPVNFILTSCLNYAFFREGGAKGQPAYQGRDRDLGYPALEPVIRLQPDFCIFDGDCVYYDHPAATRAQTVGQLRRKWHEQYVMPRFATLFSRVPTYWMKDDHDYRMNDSDPTGDYAPSHALGVATFREQVPVVNPADPQAVTYRTHRIGRDLQLWMPEGRDYRSPNNVPDGPGKSIWGVEQKAWLYRTIKESDATFKLLISPTPLVGPDDGSKRDNQVNPRGFRHEGEEFLAWLKAIGIPTNRFFILCGDRHWKYHSKHPTGYEELGCGTFNRENSRMGRAPGDPESTDPKAIVGQMYTDAAPSGGFLRVAVEPGQPARIAFTHYDDHGEVQYQYGQTAK